MNILMVTNMYPTRERPSYGAFIKSQIDSVARAGHGVEVLFIPGFRSKFAYLRAFVEIQRSLARTHFDVVHAHYGLSAIPALPCGRVPLIVSFCGDDLLGTPSGRGSLTPFSRLVVSSSRLAGRIAARVIVKSQGMKAALPPETARRATVIPNGVDFSTFRPMHRADCRQQLGLEPDRRYILFPSTPYERRKRIDLAEAATAIVRQRIPDAELLVVYHEPQERIPVYMNACDVLLMTSDWEGSSNVVKEAMACNLPVVSVDAGDAWEIIGGTAGCFRVARRPDLIAEGLELVLADVMRTNGREAIAHLELGQVANSIVGVYELALEHTRR